MQNNENLVLFALYLIPGEDGSHTSEICISCGNLYIPVQRLSVPALISVFSFRVSCAPLLSSIFNWLPGLVPQGTHRSCGQNPSCSHTFCVPSLRSTAGGQGRRLTFLSVLCGEFQVSCSVLDCLWQSSAINFNRSGARFLVSVSLGTYRGFSGKNPSLQAMFFDTHSRLKFCAPLARFVARTGPLLGSESGGMQCFF